MRIRPESGTSASASDLGANAHARAGHAKGAHSQRIGRRAGGTPDRPSQRPSLGKRAGERKKGCEHEERGRRGLPTVSSPAGPSSQAPSAAGRTIPRNRPFDIGNAWEMKTRAPSGSESEDITSVAIGMAGGGRSRGRGWRQKNRDRYTDYFFR